MVTDFKHLNWFKIWLDGMLDHKFIIDRNDPLFFDLLGHYCDKNGQMDESRFFFHDEGCWIPRLELLSNAPDALREKYSGMVVVDFIPTSEELAGWFLKIIQKKMNRLGITGAAVEFWETAKSRSRVEV